MEGFPHLLSVITFLPTVGALLLLLGSNDPKTGPMQARRVLY